MKWGVLFAVAITGLIFWGFTLYAMLHEEWVEEAAREHFAAVMGLPCAALAALLLVTLLEIRSGEISLKGLGFEFKGAAGPIVMWIFSFLAIAGAIHLLW